MTFEDQPSISVFWYGLQRRPWYGPALWYGLSSQPFRPVFQFRLFRWTLLTSFWYGLLIWPWGILSIPIQPLETAFQFSISGRPFQMAFRDSLRRRRPFDTTLRRPFKVAFQFSLLRQSSNSVFRVGLSRWPSETVLRDDLLIQPFELHVWI